MKAPTVVNVRRRQGAIGAYFDVYIGRPFNRTGMKEGSKWENPFKEGRDGTRGECIEKYRSHLLNSPDLLAALPELAELKLGCWCKPLPCHGDVLVELVEALHA